MSKWSFAYRYRKQQNGGGYDTRASNSSIVDDVMPVAIHRTTHADYHTLRYVRWLEARLAEEIKWGHRECTHDNCKSSGTDCPANKEISGER